MDGDTYHSYFISMLLQILPIFYGTGEEDPCVHLQEYERICLTLFNKEDLLNRLYFIYFPYSLRDNAYSWFMSLPPDLFSSWFSFQDEFMRTFIPRIPQSDDSLQQSMQEQLQQLQHLQLQQLQQSQVQLQEIQETCERLTATIEERQASEQQALRAHIASFTQLDGDFFYQAWDRFNNLLVECPQHGFTSYNLLNLFYEGLQLQMQEFVNVEGDLFNKEPEEARLHLKAMAEDDRKWELTFYIRTDVNQPIDAIDERSQEDEFQQSYSTNPEASHETEISTTFREVFIQIFLLCLNRNHF